jgi:hypothetical protein
VILVRHQDQSVHRHHQSAEHHWTLDRTRIGPGTIIRATVPSLVPSLVASLARDGGLGFGHGADAGVTAMRVQSDRAKSNRTEKKVMKCSLPCESNRTEKKSSIPREYLQNVWWVLYVAIRLRVYLSQEWCSLWCTIAQLFLQYAT